MKIYFLIVALFICGRVNSQNDTIRSFMLCSDTSYTIDTLRRTPKVIKLIRYQSPQSLFWIHGYEVIEKNNESEGLIVHKEYLYFNKQPIPKNIVIWQSK